MSQPSWAAWIEIFTANGLWSAILSQPSWAAWIEIMYHFNKLKGGVMSQPSWAAWIEIPKTTLIS